MLQRVDVGRRHLHSYRHLIHDEVLTAIHELSHTLRGLRVLHVNATPFGGGVSELLRTLVPLEVDCGIHAQWRTIAGDSEFFAVTKSMHNALQGQHLTLDDASRSEYLRHAHEHAADLSEHFDVIVVHDPQPAPLAMLAHDRAEHWIWRCHIDTSNPNPEHLAMLTPLLDHYDTIIFTSREFVPHELNHRDVRIIPPAIDPLSPKNRQISRSLMVNVLEWLGIDTGRPLMAQVSRFDRWKDPQGVIDVYHAAREQHPTLQLALIGSMAFDDPEAWDIYAAIRSETQDDPHIHLHTNLTGAGNIEVNAVQRWSDVVIQKSIREGFGLVISETMWKQTPVVAARVGGIPLQMADGVGGILVEDDAGFAPAVCWLLEHADAARNLAERGRARVREHFLAPRLLLNELALLATVVNPGSPAAAVTCDPVCGLPVLGMTYCSEHCRSLHAAHSETAPDTGERHAATHR